MVLDAVSTACGDAGNFELVDFSFPQRDRPMIHQVCDAPACSRHSLPGIKDVAESVFNIDCYLCAEILSSPETTISQIFAIIRLWFPHIQNNIDVFVREILRRGGHVNDRDGQNDLTLLHYAVRAGVVDSGRSGKAASLASYLITRGADLNAVCRWTHMTPLHLGAFFDSVDVVRVLLEASRGNDVNLPCLDFQGGTPLHIAAANCSVNAAKILITYGGNVLSRDFLQRLPIDCVPNEECSNTDESLKLLIPEMRKLLKESESPSPTKPSIFTDSASNSLAPSPRLKTSFSTSALPRRQEAIHDIQGQVILQSLGLNIGDKVTLGGQKSGILRYCGTTEFADGTWAGIELEKPVGRNDGSVNGIAYFVCQEKFGIFVPVGKVKVLSSVEKSSSWSRSTTPRGHSEYATPSGRTPTTISRRGSFCVPEINARPPRTSSRARSVSASRVRPGSAASTRSSSRARDEAPLRRIEDDVPRVGDRVTVAGQRRGTVRFAGETQFAEGFWLGIELDDPVGRNDGSINGVFYFSCGANRGVFAPPSRVQRVARSVSRSSSVESLNAAVDSGTSSGRRSRADIRKSSRISRDRSSRLSWGGASQGGSQSSLSSVGSTKSWASTKSTASAGGKKEALNKFVKQADKTKIAKLSEGVNVFYNDQIGIVRFIGNTHFEDGIWLGIELRTAQGRNDGSVGDRRYFRCKANHGVFVRPSKVTVRGINGAKLLIDSPSAKNK